MRSIIVSLLLIVFVFMLSSFPAFAAESCEVVYGGGKVTCPQPTTSPSSEKPTANPSQSKGGLPVHSPTSARTTPATGPETWALISLLPIGAAGICLHRKMR